MYVLTKWSLEQEQRAPPLVFEGRNYTKKKSAVTIQSDSKDLSYRTTLLLLVEIVKNKKRGKFL